MFKVVQKRDGRLVPFDEEKITKAIQRAAEKVSEEASSLAKDLTPVVTTYLHTQHPGDNILRIEEIQDAIEKVLIETGNAKIAQEYTSYREMKTKIRSAAPPDYKETTDYALFVHSSEEKIMHWDRRKIVDALLSETSIMPEVAEKISREVEEKIKDLKIKFITAPLIREIVNVKLLEYGLEKVRAQHERIGLPIRDTERLIVFRNKENANIPHNPEATNLTLAEAIKKAYALSCVFSRDVADAHIRGDIHIHDLGMIDRPYCSGQSLEYVKKFGLDLTNSLSVAKPARHPEVLLAHMMKFSAALQGHFAGAIGWDGVNIYFAPYLVGMNSRDLYQLAQMLIFEFSQQSVARGGQAIFSDINLYWEIPKHLENTPAIGPGGEYTGKTYKEYQKEAQDFAWALFSVYKEGDGSGRPFFFPKPIVHITNKFFSTDNWQKFLYHISEVAAIRGNTYFVFDRGDTTKISECCRLSFILSDEDLKEAYQPWKMRYAAIQNVTLNLPRLAYQSNGDKEKLFEKLRDVFSLACKAHIEKRRFISHLLSLDTSGPLSLLSMTRDDEPYLRLSRASYLIGLLGLNELVEYFSGKQMHEADSALKFGLEIIAYLNLLCKEYSSRYGLKFLLEQTPAESTAYRFAKLDLERYKEAAERVIKGNINKDEVYYTNSTYLNISAPLLPAERVKKEGLFHNMIEAGALTHIWLGEKQPDSGAISSFVKKVFYSTQNAQIAFSPEFTSCLDCHRTTRGLQSECSYCNSVNVEGITRITGYFSKISAWNKGKIGELHDRYRIDA
jgi:ribonucleoside-triphosphate reductase